MKIADKLFGISPERANLESPLYADYRRNVERFKVSATVFLGGLAAHMAGVDASEVVGVNAVDIASGTAISAGFLSSYVSGIMTAAEGFSLNS